MINSRKIEDLHVKVQGLCKKLIEACRIRGVEIQVTNTLRDAEYQAYLYSLGRTVKGSIVTNMQLIGPHGFGLAFDVVPVVKGKAVWNDNRLWNIIGEEGKKLGLTWGGDWKSIVDKPHFEFTDGLKAADLRAGKRPSWWNEKPTAPVKKGIVSATVLNVRKEPSLAGIVIDKLQKGAQISIIETSDEWYRIGPDKWVHSLYVKIL